MKDPQSTSDNETPVQYGPEYWAHFLDDLDDDDYSGERPHLISVDELRAAGALDVPAAWRKSLGGEEPRFLLPGFDDDDEPESPTAMQGDSDYDESSSSPDSDD